MAVGKWLAITIIVLAFLGGFIVFTFFKPDFLDKFITWTLGIIGLITVGTVVYIIFRFARK